MRAARVHAFGGPITLDAVEDPAPDDGDLTVMAVDEVLPLERAGDAHARILERYVTGKLRLDVNR